jgi:3-hydroxymyristoyl/3-hydroxydecanoyl-(acyl carrier protein) dehydratase/1-acyl-sn-glycerol-3-phosphate acyltransferase
LERIALEPAETGPSVRFAAHPPAVEIPPMPLAAEPAVPAVEQPTTEQPAARQPAMQRMDPAPSLPSVMERVQYTAAVLPPPQSGPSPGPLALESMAEQPFLAAMHQHTEALSTSNLQHIATQTAVNQRFVALQSQAMALLVQGLGQSPVQASLHGPAAGQRLTPFSAPLPSALELRQAPLRPQKAPPRAGEAPARPPEATPRPLASPTERKPLSSPLAPSPPPTGPTFDRSQLEIHASGQISAIFGQRFAVQDGFHRQVRMPEPPLLLADRVTGLDAEVGSMGLGTIWSETDISAGAWYLHQGHMPAGIMIEAGQADLMLISYLGVDFSNRNDRVYRLLGCELTYHGGLPEVGDTLAYDIHMDGHAIQGDVRLMFFHYDCRVDGEVRLAVRKGQAGFFTDAELADSDGCLWSAEEVTPPADARLDPPAVACTKRDFTEADIVAFAAGRPWDCFGPGFDRSRPHTRTPRIQDGPMLLLGPITDFDPGGGPWQRGYIKSTVQVQPETWFFDGHFKNDPCMPGTLMLEGCLQLMAFYLSAMGYTLNRDGWRFEPLNDVPFPLSCRGQVTPRCRQLTYELFVQELHDGPIPTLFADLLCTVDGLKAFHAGRLALQLRPAWPLDEGSAVLANHSEDKPVAKAGDFPFDFRSLVACANGRPSEAFGPIYGRFDGPGRVARLPNPPYHFLSRVTSTSAEIGAMAEGTEVVVEYDIPADAWYFDENGCRTIPFAVLLEAALQPCGWLASFLGCALTTDTELCFRNLDGTGTIHVDLLPDAGTLVTRVKNTGISSVASMIVVSFEVKCSVGEVGVYDLVTVFGFFPQSALENQVGLPTTDEQRALLEAAAENVVDLTKPSPPRWNRQRPSLAEPMLLMLDRIERFDPEGGPAGLGSARAVKDVDPGEWFFKAHFFQDPVQPGSLGIEAMIQLLQWLMLEKGLDEGIDKPRFEAIALGQEMSWKYRGQVIPENERISTTLELTEIRREAGGVLALADASLWVDGKRIYEASGLGMRIVSGDPPQAPARNLDPARDTWLGDHRPTWTLPALPMMSMVDLLAQGASASDPVTALYDVRIKGWLTFDGPRTLRTDRQGEHMRLVAVDTDGNETTVATARVCTGTYGRPPAPLPALSGEAMTLPYETGELFHGPAFQVLQSLVRTSAGASSVLEASTEVPIGRLNPALLDGATHGIPHDRLHIWDETLSTDKVAYPALIPQMQFFGPTPTIGTLRCEVRPDGNLGSEDFPAFQVQLIGDCGVWCSFRLVEACFDKGAIGHAPAPDRRAFLRDRIAIPGVRTSTLTDGVTRLNEADVAAIDWLPGTVHGIYGSRDPSEIAVREHIAAANGVHPGIVPAGLPLQRFDLHTERDGDEVVVTGDGRGVQCLDPVVDFWTRWFDRDPWLVEDLYFGLIERFLGRVVLTDPDAFDAVHGRSLLYVANHQVGVESLLFSIIASGLTGVPTVTLAKAEHRHTWLGMLIAHCFAYPGVADPRVITFFDRQDKASLPAILGELAEDMTGSARSVMVHVEGTRSLDCTVPVQKMSGAFLDMAIAVNAPVVPVRFVGGLPRQTLGQRLEFPLGMGRQDIYFGRPMLPENLARMPYGERRQRVLAAINALGPGHAIEEPFAGDVDFANGVAKWQAEHGVSEEHAVLGCILTERQEPTAETRLLLAAKTSAALGDEAVGRWLTELARRVLGRE